MFVSAIPIISILLSLQYSSRSISFSLFLLIPFMLCIPILTLSYVHSSPSSLPLLSLLLVLVSFCCFALASFPSRLLPAFVNWPSANIRSDLGPSSPGPLLSHLISGGGCRYLYSDVVHVPPLDLYLAVLLFFSSPHMF
jgi:hypothetical protein